MFAKLLLLCALLPLAHAMTCGDVHAIYQSSSCCGAQSSSASCLNTIPLCADASAGHVCVDDNNNVIVKGLLDRLGFDTADTLTLKAHLIPDTNANYDLGNAEYKIRYTFVSDT